MQQNLKGYELRERIGAGGFGAVHRAYQTTIGREVAIKIILPALANQPEFVRRFEGEAQLIARLEHPHIIPLYDYWRDPDGAYLVMRWMRGGSLYTVLQNGPYDLRSAAMLLDQVTGALALAHRNHVIHRDVKPGNILLDEDGNAYLSDFGIAKNLVLPDTNLQSELFLGSLDYIAPEQARGEAITARTDIYSLGVTLYETITGEHPFHNNSSVERLYNHINDPLPEITTLDAALSRPVNQVIQKATAKNPDQRYSDVLAFAADFREAIGANRSTTNVVELLTQREQEILHLIVEGLSNKEIAQRLTVTLSTVKWYVNQIYNKLGVRSRVQAMVRARELHLLTSSTDLPTVAPVATEDFQPKNPYKGLRAFQTGDNEDFFGREKTTTKLIKRLEETHEFNRFLAVIGPSGSGKSSLVKAGLIPALWRGDLSGSEKWFVVEMVPGAQPLEELEIALTRVAANQSGSLKDHLTRDKRGLIRAAQLILPNDGSDLVLVIDQFEEVFTLLEDEAARIAFLDLLYTAVIEPRSRIRIVITLRADFYDRPLHYPEFGEMLRSRLETILPLSVQELERAISKPAERIGAVFDSGLVATIVAEVNYQAGALPLLQYALTELFERRQGRLLTSAAYEAIGGTVGALARRADELYQNFNAPGQSAIQQLFLRLVTLGEGNEDTRRRVHRSELLAIASDLDLMDEVIDTYAEYRLLSLDNEPGTRSPTVELAHEAILRAWERLRNWLAGSREEIKFQRQMGGMAAEWYAANRDASFLARGSRLSQFESWAQNTQLALTGAERTYLDASIAQRQLEEAAELEQEARVKALERRSVRFLRTLVAVLLIALLGALSLTGLAVNQSQIAGRNAAEAQVVALTSASQAKFAEGNTDQAIALALQAVTLDPTSANAQSALSAAAYAPGTIRVFTGHTAAVNAVILSPSGKLALSAADDKTLILWDVATGQAVRRFEGHTDRVTTIAFMPDGQTAISGAQDGTLIQWNIETGDLIRRIDPQVGAVWAVAISPDGRYAAAAGANSVITLWDTQTWTLVRQFEGHTDEIEGLSFSADGSQLLSAGNAHLVILWDVQTGALIRRFAGHTDTVYLALFSADQRTILSGSGDGTMIFWDIDTGEMIRRFYQKGGAAIFSVSLSPDGRVALSGGIGGITEWNVGTAQPISALLGHKGNINSLIFGRDGKTALTASADGTLRLWDVEQGQVIRHFSSEGTYWNDFTVSSDAQKMLVTWRSDQQSNAVLTDVNTGEEIRRYSTEQVLATVAFSPNGQQALLDIYSDGSSGELILWDIRTGEAIRHIGGHLTGVAGIAFSPDGRVVASADESGTIALWDVETGQEIRHFPRPDGPNVIWNYIAFGPDGQSIITTLEDNRIILWDTSTGREIRQFVGHSARALSFRFSGDGQRGLTGSDDDSIILWDTATGSILRRWIYSSPVPRVDISADGRFGIGGSPPNLIDLSTGQATRLYTTAAFSFFFAPDARTAVMGAFPDQFELWRIDRTLDELLAWTRANRYIPDLTCDQRTLYRLEPLCETDSTAQPTEAK